MVMNEIARPGATADGGSGADDPSGRLAALEARTQTPLDLLALITLWLTVVPPWHFGHEITVYTARLCLSLVYGVDLLVRGILARRPVRYALSHPIALASVIFPPVRVIFSVRLVRSMFRRGNLSRFLLAAFVLVLNCAAIVYLYERHAPGSNIRTLGESVWWSIVTVTTVGYGDYVPVTMPGRVTASFLMAIGVLTLAVITAQVASSFVTQGASRDQRDARPEPAPAGGTGAEAAPAEVTLAELDRRLARIEELLLAAAPSSWRTGEAPERE